MIKNRTENEINKEQLSRTAGFS